MIQYYKILKKGENIFYKILRGYNKIRLAVN